MRFSLFVLILSTSLVACSSLGLNPEDTVCTVSSDCEDGFTCQGEPGCGNVWTCQPAPALCTLDLVFYCGCDGRTFTSSGSCAGAQHDNVGACDDAPVVGQSMTDRCVDLCVSDTFCGSWSVNDCAGECSNIVAASSMLGCVEALGDMLDCYESAGACTPECRGTHNALTDCQVAQTVANYTQLCDDCGGDFAGCVEAQQEVVFLNPEQNWLEASMDVAECLAGTGPCECL